MKPWRVILMLLAFLLLHEGHAIYAWIEAAGWVEVNTENYAMVTDLTNAFAIILVLMVWHSQAVGAIREAVSLMLVYMAVQVFWLVADPVRCDTLTAEVATVGIACWFYLIYDYMGSLRRFPRIRTHP
jgi:hypothetical protein